MKRNTLATIVFIVIVLLLGLVNHISGYETYYAGCIFFFAGLLMSLQQYNSYIVVFMPLLTHGGLGLAIMILSKLSLTFNNGTIGEIELNFGPALSDNHGYLIPYLYIVGLLIISGFVTSGMFINSETFRGKRNSLIIVYSLFTIAIAMVAFLPKIIMYL